jgi:carbonic anhydrase/acetyltransferase-like protein (isoleucine patch superfamily)
MGGFIRAYRGILPTIADDAFIAPNATVVGAVTIGAGASIWFNTVLRGDVGKILVGAGTNIQDGTIVHVTRQRYDTVIGANVLIGHKAMIHGATLEDGCFIGMGATILDGVVVEGQAMVAAGALVTPGKRIKQGELWAGSPAKLMRMLSQEEIDAFPRQVAGYQDLGQEYRSVIDG